jgi:hypothetical protein
MQGIVTMYRGRRFRSRLEARWAAMFDLLGWKYEYEPYDLEGWIPDFVLFGSGEILAEVKPYSLLEEFDTVKIINALKETEKWGKEILLLGSSIWGSYPSILGWLGEFLGGDYWFGRAILNYYAEKWGFYHEYGYWGDRMTGLYDGDHYLDWPDYEKVVKLWNQAGNIVQFRGEPDGQI